MNILEPSEQWLEGHIENVDMIIEDQEIDNPEEFAKEYLSNLGINADLLDLEYTDTGLELLR